MLVLILLNDSCYIGISEIKIQMISWKLFFKRKKEREHDYDQDSSNKQLKPK